MTLTSGKRKSVCVPGKRPQQALGAAAATLRYTVARTLLHEE